MDFERWSTAGLDMQDANSSVAKIHWNSLVDLLKLIKIRYNFINLYKHFAIMAELIN
jgi:hypothetical protein